MIAPARGKQRWLVFLLKALAFLGNVLADIGRGESRAAISATLPSAEDGGVLLGLGNRLRRTSDELDERTVGIRATIHHVHDHDRVPREDTARRAHGHHPHGGVYSRWRRIPSCA